MRFGRHLAGVLAGLTLSIFLVGSATASDAISPFQPTPSAGERSGLPDLPGPGEISPRKAVFRLDGRRWPVRTIPVFDTTRGAGRKVVKAAIRAWNRSGVRIRFKRAKRRGGRQIVVYSDRDLNGGKASVGYIGRRGLVPYPGNGPDCKISGRMPTKKYVRLVKKKCPWVKLFKVKRGGGRMWLQSMPATEVGENFRQLLAMTVHEFGHTLGLDHIDTACLVMNTIPRSGCAFDPNDPVKVMCRVPMPGDVKGVVKRYGGRVKVRQPKRNLCDKFRRPAAPELRVDHSGGGVMVLTVTTGFMPRPYAAWPNNGQANVLVSNSPICPYAKGGDPAAVLPVSYGLTTFDLPPEPVAKRPFPRFVADPAPSFPGDRLCAAAFVYDRFVRSSRLSAPVILPAP